MDYFGVTLLVAGIFSVVLAERGSDLLVLHIDKQPMAFKTKKIRNN